MVRLEATWSLIDSSDLVNRFKIKKYAYNFAKRVKNRGIKEYKNVCKNIKYVIKNRMYNTVRQDTLRVCALCNVHGQCTVYKCKCFFCFHTLVKAT